MEERIARLESDVSHLRTDVAEMKLDIRRVDGKVDALRDEMRKGFSAMERSMGEMKLNMEKLAGEMRLGLGDVRNSINRRTISLLLSAGALTATLLGVMAKGFHWIGG